MRSSSCRVILFTPVCLAVLLVSSSAKSFRTTQAVTADQTLRLAGAYMQAVRTPRSKAWWFRKTINKSSSQCAQVRQAPPLGNCGPICSCSALADSGG